MTIYSQLPGALDVEIGLGDDFSLLLDFDISLTGYTFAASVVKRNDNSLTAIAVTNTNLATGQITLSLTDAQVTALGTEQHKWYLVWTTGTSSRRVLAGNFTVKAYLP